MSKSHVNTKPEGSVKPNTYPHRNPHQLFHRPRSAVHQWGKIWHTWNFQLLFPTLPHMQRSKHEYLRNANQDCGILIPSLKFVHCHCIDDSRQKFKKWRHLKQHYNFKVQQVTTPFRKRLFPKVVSIKLKHDLTRTEPEIGCHQSNIARLMFKPKGQIWRHVTKLNI